VERNLEPPLRTVFTDRDHIVRWPGARITKPLPGSMLSSNSGPSYL